jgi:hypothetical protein
MTHSPSSLGKHPDQTLDISEIRQTYYDASAKASDIIRQLALAGLAFVWVFSGGGRFTAASRFHFPDDLLVVGLVLVITLAVDLLHYLWRTAAFGIYGWWVEEHPTQYSALLKVPKSINRVTIGFFVAKAAALATAYALLVIALVSRIT